LELVLDSLVIEFEIFLLFGDLEVHSILFMRIELDLVGIEVMQGLDSFNFVLDPAQFDSTGHGKAMTFLEVCDESLSLRQMSHCKFLALSNMIC
jgi:hypothetical protein